MNIPDIGKTYSCYKEFFNEFIRSAMQNKSAFIIVNWKNAEGICSLLNGLTVNDISFYMNPEFSSEMQNDIKEISESNGNMIITLFADGEFLCEKALDNEEAYVDDGEYFVESNARNFTVPLHATIIPFKISI